MFQTAKKYSVHKFKKHHQSFCVFRRVYAKSTQADLAQAYLPNEVEAKELDCYSYFKPKAKNNSFQILLPPPNITGNLHLGHALTATIQDVIIRWKQMQGIESVWIPGIDHAGIATQVIVEKLLWKEKQKSRHDIGRKAFEETIWKWKEQKAQTIEKQLRRLGASLDWPHMIFTMDPLHSMQVTKAFIKLFESDMIYRANHLVNWSCTLQSAISDIEVDYIEIDGPTLISVPQYKKPIEFGTFMRFAYKVHESDEEIVVATTRPETLFGDVAVAVNPKDARYSSFVGKKLWHPFRNETIPIVFDDSVDSSFGTGAVKITPAHDPFDFELATRHLLPNLQVIDESGNMTSLCGEFSGMKRFQVRDLIGEKLKSLDLFRGKESHKMVVPICSRSKDVVEHLVKPQWFIKCSEMAKEAVDDVREGRLQIEPKRFEKVWYDWLENTRDWCVSRQLWWGHRIPMYFCHPVEDSENAAWIAGESMDQAVTKASLHFSKAKENMTVRQDDDVLDTWFSSALIPFAAQFSQQSAEKTNKYNYPLDLMETGHDILFFWVARMVMLCKKMTGRLPFNKVLLHGIICDAHGRKMSKSLGNVVQPEDVIKGATLEELEAAIRSNHTAGIISSKELSKAIKGQKKLFPSGIPECGVDALRFTLCAHNIKNHFINFDIQECHANRMFCNKIWQAVRYTNNAMENISLELLKPVEFQDLAPMDKWILSKLSHMVQMCRKGIEDYDFYLATNAIKEFSYYEFCDVYLESTKRAFKTSFEKEKAAGHCWTLTKCLETTLRTLAPFMPRLSQHLHQRLILHPNVERLFEFPQVLEYRDHSLEEQVEKILQVVIAVRRLKKMFGVTAKHSPEAFIFAEGDTFKQFQQVIQDLSALNKLTVSTKVDENDTKNGCVEDRVAAGAVIRLVVPDELRKSFELDLPKLEAKKVKLIKDLERMKKMMSAVNYAVKATQEEQLLNSKKLSGLEEKITRISYMQNFAASK